MGHTKQNTGKPNRAAVSNDPPAITWRESRAWRRVALHAPQLEEEEAFALASHLPQAPPGREAPSVRMVSFAD